jgi:hypothetical protein
MALSHGLCLGKRQLTILTPSPLCLARRLCLPSQRLTSLEVCQLALSQMRTSTFLPISSSFSRLHSRNWVVESQPRLIELGQIEPVAGDGFGLGIVFSDRLLDETHRLTLLSPATEGGQSKPAPPAFILETDGPLGLASATAINRSRRLFFFRTRGPEK